MAQLSFQSTSVQENPKWKLWSEKRLLFSWKGTFSASTPSLRFWSRLSVSPFKSASNFKNPPADLMHTLFNETSLRGSPGGGGLFGQNIAQNPHNRTGSQTEIWSRATSCFTKYLPYWLKKFHKYFSVKILIEIFSPGGYMVSVSFWRSIVCLQRTCTIVLYVLQIFNDISVNTHHRMTVS